MASRPDTGEASRRAAEAQEPTELSVDRHVPVASTGASIGDAPPPVIDTSASENEVQGAPVVDTSASEGGPVDENLDENLDVVR